MARKTRMSPIGGGFLVAPAIAQNDAVAEVMGSYKRPGVTVEVDPSDAGGLTYWSVRMSRGRADAIAKEVKKLLERRVGDVELCVGDAADVSYATWLKHVKH